MTLARLVATATCATGCGWTHGPTLDVAACDREARRHTGQLPGGPTPGHGTVCETRPA